MSGGPPSADSLDALAALPLPLVTMHPDGTVTATNREAALVSGYAVDEMVGRAFWLEVTHPEDRHRLTRALRDAAGRGRARASVRFRTKDGVMRRVELHLQPVGDGVGGALVDVTEQDEVAAALYQNEMLYHTFLEQSPVGIAHLDAEGVVTFENYQLRAITGEDPEAAWIGRSLREIPHLDEQLPPLAERMLAVGRSFSGEDFVIVRSDGERRIAHVRGTAIQHPEEGIVGGVLMVSDVTEEHEREAELRVLRRYDEAGLALRDAALGASTPHAFLDAAAHILGKTARADRVFVLLPVQGADAYEERARWGADAHPSAPRLRLDAAAWRALACGEVAAADMDALATVGAGAVVGITFTTEEQQPGGLLLARTDPADGGWEEVECNALGHLGVLFETLWSWMAAEARYRQVVSSVEDSLFSFSFDADGERVYSFASRQMEAMTGYAVDDLLSGRVSWRTHIVFEDDRDAVARHEEALRDEQESRLVYRIRTASGHLRWLRESATPGRDRSGYVVAGILSDVTEAKETEATLVQAQQDAESATRMKSTFLATMSHEIRTPLGTISGFADLLLEEIEGMRGEAPVVVTEFAETIRTSSQKVLRLVNDIFDLASLQSGRLYVDLAPVALHPLLTSVAQQHEAALAARGVRLVLDLAAGDPIVLGQTSRIEQVAEHLVSNAAKFTEEGEVRIATALTEAGVQITVADTGIGVEPDYLAELFEPFSQEDNRLNRDYEGSGLGLAIVKRLVEAMKGTIGVASAKGAGTTFTVTLPRADG
jgi:PAS domain S-box-containing protein